MSITPRIDKVEGIRDVPAEHSHYYVVLRDGRRVSDSNHVTIESADIEKTYWKNILSRWPDGTSIEVHKCQNVNHKQ
jgi:hypothetical protein